MSKLHYFITGSFLLGMLACGKTETPVNPYDSVDYSTNTTTEPEPDPSSITGLHKNIFIKKCAMSGCHDGTFEPDYRTVQSSWTTMVYQSVNILTVNNIDSFQYRVIPGDFQHSFLYERITTTTPDYMPSNGSRLTSQEIGFIKKWIEDGAKDVNGNVPPVPNLLPNITGYIAIDPSLVQLDTNRVNDIPYYPFYVPGSSLFYLVPFISDTSDGALATDPQNFINVRIRVSTDKSMTGAITINGIWMSPFLYPVWQIPVNTGLWTVGTTLYFRIYGNDGLHPIDAEMPKDQSLDYYKSFYAFTIQ